MAQRDRLSIWMYGRHVATLSKERDRLGLVYTEEAQEAYDVNTPLLSISLPVLPKSFRHEKVRPFFDGLLPEGESRRMLAHDFRVQEDDTFGLLRVLGRDCAGAIVILPEGDVLPDPTANEPSPMSQEEVVTRLRQLNTEPLGVDQRVRISLAGVQRKMVLSCLPTGDWSLPIDGLPSTHILKRADPRFAHMVANEAFCLAIGRRLGMQVADVTIIEIPEPILVVTRYDREVADTGEIGRVHQEDFAQAFGINASAKYEEHGGPGLRKVARLLRDETVGSDSLERLLDVTLLNVIVGNADAHAKNFSLLHPKPGVVRLAPAYDIMSTAFYPQADERPGMYVNQKTSIHAITKTDVIKEAISWGLHRDRVIARVEQLLSRLLAAIEAAAGDVPSVPEELVACVKTRAEAFAA